MSPVAEKCVAEVSWCYLKSIIKLCGIGRKPWKMKSLGRFSFGSHLQLKTSIFSTELLELFANIMKRLEEAGHSLISWQKVRVWFRENWSNTSRNAQNTLTRSAIEALRLNFSLSGISNFLRTQTWWIELRKILEDSSWRERTWHTYAR